MSIINQISSANNQSELSGIVESYLDSIGQTELARGETFEETAERLGDEIMEYAARRWWELES